MSLNLKKKNACSLVSLTSFPFYSSFPSMISYSSRVCVAPHDTCSFSLSFPGLPALPALEPFRALSTALFFCCIFFLQFSVDITQFQGFSYAVCVAGLWFSTATSNLSSDLQSNIFNAFNLSTWLYHRLHQCPNVNWSSSFHTRYSCVFNIRKCHPRHPWSPW